MVMEQPNHLERCVKTRRSMDHQIGSGCSGIHGSMGIPQGRLQCGRSRDAANSDLRVSDLIGTEIQQNEAKVRKTGTREDAELILSMSIPHERRKDKYIWPHSKDGKP